MVIYKYDLDADGKKEKFRCDINESYPNYGYILDLYINRQSMKKYNSLDIPVLSIYDCNKKDKSLDLTIETYI